jgi:transcriptional regulator with XRE-family HTH domain
MQIFANRLRERRLAAGYTQQSFASVLGIGERRYAHWETGRFRPPIDMLPVMCARLGTTPDYLLGVSDESRSSQAQTARIAQIEQQINILHQELRNIARK